MSDDSLILLRVIDRVRCRKRLAKSFFKKNQRIMRMDFVFLPVKVRIEFWILMLPVVVL
jgi:hypothetical protein